VFFEDVDFLTTFFFFKSIYVIAIALPPNNVKANMFCVFVFITI
jgi:hypothetical protein